MLHKLCIVKNSVKEFEQFIDWKIIIVCHQMPHHSGAPAVVKVTQWENWIFGVTPRKNYCDEMWHNWLRRGGTPHAKVGSSRITGGVSPYGWHVPLRHSPNYFFYVTVLFRQAYRWDRCMNRFSRAICQNMWYRGNCIPLGLEWWRHNFRGSKSPQNPQNWRE